MTWSLRRKNGPSPIPAQLFRSNETAQKQIFKTGHSLPTSQATPRPLLGVACPPATSEKVGPTKQDYSIDGGQAAHGPRMSHAQAWYGPLPGPSLATPGPLLGPSQARCFDERENLGGQNGWKFKKSMPGKGFIICWLSKNNNNINYDKLSACI